MSSTPDLPRLLSADQVVPTMRVSIAMVKAAQDRVVGSVKLTDACFDSVMLPWAMAENQAQTVQGIIELLKYASPDPAVHDAVAAATTLEEEAEAGWLRRADLFKLVKATSEKNETLDEESRHYLRDKLQRFVDAGHGSLGDDGIKRFLEINNRIEEVTKAYNKTLIEERPGAWYSEKDELQGLSAHELSGWKAGQGEQQGLLYGPPANSGLKVLQYLDNPTTRRKMYLQNRKGLAENAKIFHEIVVLRDERARLIGYDNHAAMRIKTRAIRSLEQVESFLGELEKTIIPKGVEEMAQLQSIRREDCKRWGVWEEGDDKGLPPWDMAYYETQQMKAAGVSDANVAPFFPLDTTISKMLKLFESYLSLQFKKIPDARLDESTLWHPTVQAWETYRDGSFVGFLYLDLLARDHKYKGSQCVNIHCGYEKQDGSRQLPATVLMCSFPAPTESSCAQLRHGEVVTLFHELGHGIHDLVARTKYAHFHGYHLPVDIGEMPSTLLENWCWTKDVLRHLSCHYTKLDSKYLQQWRQDNANSPDPAEKIDEDTLDKIIKIRNIHRAISVFDLKIHAAKSHEEAQSLNLSKLWYDCRERYEGLDCSEARQSEHEHASFGHLLNGYDVGYYGYLACAAFAKDAFYSQFVDDISNKQTWGRFEQYVLRPGGSLDNQLQMVDDFLGRQPNFSALAESLFLILEMVK
ncbi:metallopeptidase MepB [Cordyceps militaris CM01]|uniref:Metallopeptidase MepB n=1 Tax=Cordyceps militaris (strain CM01) TaxID=983644 RepID=G3JIM3_CORMM|nr:metallopeptidase MepB [Cordyceps militaris CM01]EGX91920.1 metallopeptidase MepB [Cordyceps militaris CM01]